MFEWKVVNSRSCCCYSSESTLEAHIPRQLQVCLSRFSQSSNPNQASNLSQAAIQIKQQSKSSKQFKSCDWSQLKLKESAIRHSAARAQDACLNKILQISNQVRFWDVWRQGNKPLGLQRLWSHQVFQKDIKTPDLECDWSSVACLQSSSPVPFLLQHRIDQAQSLGRRCRRMMVGYKGKRMSVLRAAGMEIWLWIHPYTIHVCPYTIIAHPLIHWHHHKSYKWHNWHHRPILSLKMATISKKSLKSKK